MTAPFALLLALLASATLAQAQAPVSTPAPQASAPRGSPPPRQQMSPEAQRNSATAPGEMRPERPALPQVSVPLGQPPAEPPATGPRPPGPAASTPGVSDAVARCEAKTSAAERRRCRRELAHQAPTAAPQR